MHIPITTNLELKLGRQRGGALQTRVGQEEMLCNWNRKW